MSFTSALFSIATYFLCIAVIPPVYRTVMESDSSNTLELLRELINTSIDTVKEDLDRHNDPPLNLNTSKRHPIRDRYDQQVSRALKCLSSAGLMLRAVCDPDAWVHDIMFNFADLTALFVACQADVANLLQGEALGATTIAERADIDPGKLSRHLRALCNMHIFQETGHDVYKNNEISLLFQSDSRKALVGLCAEESRLASCKMWEALTRPDFKGTVSAKKAAFNIAYDTDLNIFEYWRDVRPDLGQRGARAFAGKGLNEEQYLALYPWAEEPDGTLIVDMGGGVGGATLPIINKFGNLKLQVQDLPENQEKFQKFIQAEYPNITHAARATFQIQDLFKENKTNNAPIYFLRHVLHDWPDIEAVNILNFIRAAMSDSSKLLICEHIVVPAYRETAATDEDATFIAPRPLLPNWGAGFTSRLDLHVLSCINSKQRTEDDFRALATKAGLIVSHVWRNMGDETIIECHLA